MRTRNLSMLGVLAACGMAFGRTIEAQSEGDVIFGTIEWDGNVPGKQGVGGGGRRSPFLDAVRKQVGPTTQGGNAKPMVIPVIPDANKDGDDFEAASKRITAKVHRDGALDFPVSIRTEKDTVMNLPGGKSHKGVVIIYPVSPNLEQTSAKGTPNAATTEAIASQLNGAAPSPTINVTAPATQPGDEIVVSKDANGNVRMRHVRPEPAVPATNAANTAKAGNRSTGGKRK